MGFIISKKTGKKFNNLYEWMKWRHEVEESCHHNTKSKHLQATTKRGTYHALECPDCGKRLKYWRT